VGRGFVWGVRMGGVWVLKRQGEGGSGGRERRQVCVRALLFFFNPKYMRSTASHTHTDLPPLFPFPIAPADMPAPAPTSARATATTATAAAAAPPASAPHRTRPGTARDEEEIEGAKVRE
jgi:hypothetical protein